MLVGFTEEQVYLGQSCRSLLERVAGERDVRRLMATDHGMDGAVWARLYELGLVGLTVPERFGGLGGGLVDLGVVLEEMGRRLLPGPFFATEALAVQALRNAGDDAAARDHLAAIAAGTTTATLAVTEGTGRWDEPEVRLRADRVDGSWRLHGGKSYVPDGARADLLLVAARTGSGVGLFSVPGDARGLTRRPLPTMDQTRKQADLEFAGVPARLIGDEGGAWPGLARTIRICSVALAAEQVGGAQAVLDLVIEHARTREQFGRPIGAFQAVQHRCADMALDLEGARSAAYYGLRAMDEDGSEADTAASLAKAYCSAMYRRVTDMAVQIFGGIGLTWEHSIHLYFKRARSSEVLLGSPAFHRELVAQAIGL
jgi:alkylation response protein AidB-like acyl-CoA dehydrogenase